MVAPPEGSQLVPSIAFVPVSMHTGAPEPHTVVPAWHRLAGVHACPATHGTQAPLALHTLPVPHDAPTALLAPSPQTEAPVEHDVVPTLQGLLFVVHERPGVQAMQVPPLQ